MRRVQQVRPGNDPGAAVYAPQRDIANLYLPMLREVFRGLDRENWESPLREWLEETGVTEEQMGQVVQVITEAHRLFVRDQEVSSPLEALRKAGIDDLPPAVRVAFFERLGLTVFGGFFVALRDVTLQGQPSSLHDELVTAVAAGREVAVELSGQARQRDDPSRESILAAEVEELRRVVAQAEETRRQLQKQLADRDVSLHQETQIQEAWRAKLDYLQPLRQYIKKLRTSSWPTRIWMAIRLGIVLAGKGRI